MENMSLLKPEYSMCLLIRNMEEGFKGFEQQGLRVGYGLVHSQ